jgi:methyltransferase (TIGR00027 family)
MIGTSADSIHHVISEQLSHTAFAAAAARAAHLLVDQPPTIFADTLAERLLGDRADELIAYHRAYGVHPVLSSARAQATARARFMENHLAEAVRRGVYQYVLLGAGLDTFAYRSPLAGQVHTFEVDHPATQQWKTSTLSGVAARGAVTFIPVDLETQALLDRLTGAGFDPCRPALVGWLGVSMYLSRPAIEEVLAAIGGLVAGTELVFDHILPAGLRDPDGDEYVEAVAPAAAERGEPWLTYQSPEDAAALLHRHGFGHVRCVTQRESVDAALWNRTDSLRPIRLSALALGTVSGVTRA